MQLLTKTGKPIINRVTKLPIYSQPVDYRINNIYKELTGLTKRQALAALNNDKLSDNWKNEIKSIIFAVKLAGINSSMKSLNANFS